MDQHSATAWIVVRALRYSGTYSTSVHSLSAASMRKGKPRVGKDEIAVRVKLTIPDAAFLTPEYSVSADVAVDRVLQPRPEIEVLPIEETG